MRHQARRLRRWINRGFETIWSGGFAGLRWIFRPQAELWHSEGEQTVMILAPHPDDEVAGCVGAVARHREVGDRVVVVHVTDGRGSGAYGLSPEDMAQTRRREASLAAEILGLETVEWLGLPEREWTDDELLAPLKALLDQYRPQVIYTSSRVDFHPDHERVARLLGKALNAEGETLQSREPTIRLYAVHVPLTTVLCNFIVPMPDGPEEAERALRAYYSQVGTLLRCLRHRHHLGRLYGFSHPAEAFWQLTVEQFRRLHHEVPARPLVESFRGLRYDAWSDPLAYGVGRGERRRLRRLALGGCADGA